VPASRRRSVRPPPPDALKTAFRLLGQRAHAEGELRRKLLARGCPRDEVERSVARLRELGYLDDAAFARELVARRERTRGSRMIAAELAARGVTREVAEAAVAAVDHDAAVAAARALASRSPAVDRRRLAERLTRRGFAEDVVREALDVAPDVD